jgi:hypothetical protein
MSPKGPDQGLAAYAAQWDHPIDLGVVRAVKVLRDHDIATTQSCEGGEGHSRQRPTVWFRASPGEAWKALGWLLDYDLPIRSLSATWVFDHDNFPQGPEWVVEFKRKLD